MPPHLTYADLAHLTHEPEPFGGSVFVSRANHAAASHCGSHPGSEPMVSCAWCPRRRRSDRGESADGWVAVGTRVASRPPHGSVRAPLCIRLLPWVFDGKSLVWPRMEDSRLWEPVVRQLLHPGPDDVTFLAAATKCAPPAVDDSESECAQCSPVCWYCMVPGAAVWHDTIAPMSRNYPLRPETIARFVREGRLTEREALLLRGTPSTRGFRGPLQASLTWLEDRSPGVRKRWAGDRWKGWPRNFGPGLEKLMQGANRRTGVPFPPSQFRCTATSKRTGERCRNWGHPWPDGSRCPTCRYHGALGAPYGKLAWRWGMRWDGKQHRKMAVPVRRSDITTEDPKEIS